MAAMLSAALPTGSGASVAFFAFRFSFFLAALDFAAALAAVSAAAPSSRC